MSLVVQYLMGQLEWLHRGLDCKNPLRELSAWDMDLIREEDLRGLSRAAELGHDCISQTAAVLQRCHGLHLKVK